MQWFDDAICLMFLHCSLTRAALVSPAERAALGGGKYYPLLTQKRRAVEIHVMRQSKSRNEKIQICAYVFLNKLKVKT